MKNRYLEGLALGLTLGFIACTVFFWALEETNGLIQKFLSNQISYIVTLTAAAMALIGISNQIQSNVDLSEKARLAKLDAARATLPIVLSNIHQLAEERMYAVAFGNPTPLEDAKWNISDTELSYLKEAIEHSDDVEKQLMLEICRVYQVLSMRWEKIDFENLFLAPPVVNTSVNILIRYEQFNAIRDWAALKSICSALFDYARGELSSPSSDEMISNVIRTLEWVNDGGRAAAGGILLTNNVDFQRYVDVLKEKRNVPLILKGWKSNQFL